MHVGLFQARIQFFSVLHFLLLQLCYSFAWMAPDNLSNEGKATILACRNENITMKEIVKLIERKKRTIRGMVAATQDPPLLMVSP